MIPHPHPASATPPHNLCLGTRASQARLYWLACHAALHGDHAISCEGLRTIHATRDFAEAPLLRAAAANWLRVYLGGGYDVMPIAATVEG